MYITELELIGLIMYKCEGTKLRKDKRYKNTYYYAIEFTNSDPEIIKLFLEFLRKILAVEETKLKCQLFIYKDQTQEEIKNFWIDKTNILRNNFQKPIIFNGKDRFKPSDYGTCKLRYCDKDIFLKLNELIINRLGSPLSLIQ